MLSSLEMIEGPQLEAHHSQVTFVVTSSYIRLDDYFARIINYNIK